jgi:hypothetical protein
VHLYIYTVTAPENNASGRQRMSACMIATVFINTTSSACGHFPPRVCVRVTYICTCTDVHYISRVTYIFHFSIEKHYTMIPTACSCASCAAGSVKTRPAAVRLYSDCTGKQCNPPCFWTHASAWSLVLQCIYDCYPIHQFSISALTSPPHDSEFETEKVVVRRVTHPSRTTIRRAARRVESRVDPRHDPRL